MKRTAFMTLAACLLWTAPPAMAQESGDNPAENPELWSPHVRPELWENIQDSVYRLRVLPRNDTITLSGADTVPRGWFSASYEYTMVYDPACRAHFLLTEWKRNGARLRLPNWQSRRIVHSHADILGFNSRTDVFPLVAGDTLSFCREFEWANPVTNRQDTNNYFAADTLDFAVELVRRSDSTRIALLDSMGVLANTAPAAPVIYGMRPLIAKVSYVVPSSIAGDSAFMRLRLYARGSGQYHFVRRDGVTIGFSQSLNDPRTLNYLAIFGKVFTKTTVNGLEAAPQSPARLTVTAGGAAREITVAFSCAPDGGETAVAVYDITGRLIFSPYTSPASSGERTLVHRIPGGGVYFVALYHNGKLVRTQKVTL